MLEHTVHSSKTTKPHKAYSSIDPQNHQFPIITSLSDS